MNLNGQSHYITDVCTFCTFVCFTNLIIIIIIIIVQALQHSQDLHIDRYWNRMGSLSFRNV